MPSAQAAKAELDEVNRRLEHSRRTLAFVSATAAALRNPRAECAVCFERLRGKPVTVLRCLHAFDHGCIARLLVAHGRAGGNRGTPGYGDRGARLVVCPLCRSPTRRKNMCTFIHKPPDGEDNEKDDDVAEGEEREGGASKGRDVALAGSDSRVDITGYEGLKGGDGGGDGVVSSGADSRGAKVVMLVDTLKGILSANPDEKVIVFAQWAETVVAVAAALADAARDPGAGNAAGLGLGALTLLGSAAERAAAVALFQSDDPDTPRVLCLSYRLHAAGLNLHRANHVVVVHPFAAPTISPHAPDLMPLAQVGL